MTGEIADGWIALHHSPDSVKTYRALIEEGLAKRTDGKSLKDFALRVSFAIQVTRDVRTALDVLKPSVALNVGGMGAKSKNFHKDCMIQRGYAEAADRIQELYLAGRKDEAAAAGRTNSWTMKCWLDHRIASGTAGSPGWIGASRE